MRKRNTAGNYAMKCCIAFLSGMFTVSAMFAQSKEEAARIDSVFTAIDAMPDDTAKVNYINSISREFLWQFNSPESYNKLKYAAKLSQKLGYDKGEYSSYANMASYCLRSNNQDYAMQNRSRALAIALRMKDTVRIVSQWTGLGLIYLSKGEHSTALDCFLRVKPSAEASGDTDRIARVYAFLGWTYSAMKQDSLALVYQYRALALREAINYHEGVFASLNSIRSEYLAYGRLEEALAISRRMQAEEARVSNAYGTAAANAWIAEIKEKQGDLDSALFFYARAEAGGQELNDVHLLRDAYGGLARVLDAKGDANRAYSYFKKHTHLKDSLLKVEIATNEERTREVYDVESKIQEIELLNKDKELKEKDLSEKQKTLWGLTLILGITAALAVIVFAGYRRKKRMAADLAEQKKIIEAKNSDITASIVYAQRIQQAILPSLKQIKDAIPGSFVLYKPKDIVSGDFFWFNETADSWYLAAVDCTGHGVPGALMSMIGYNFLGQIVNEMQVRRPPDILNELHKKVLLALNKDLATHDIKDGMDVALVRIRKDKSVIEFSGAVRPLYLVRSNELQVIKGDIYSIGGIKEVDDATPFSQHSIPYEAGTLVYLFSDGFADQFGGPHGKKFKYSQLRTVLLRISTLPPEEQAEVLEKTFKEWKGNLEQVDDVMVIGVKL